MLNSKSAGTPAIWNVRLCENEGGGANSGKRVVRVGSGEDEVCRRGNVGPQAEPARCARVRSAPRKEKAI